MSQTSDRSNMPGVLAVAEPRCRSPHHSFPGHPYANEPCSACRSIEWRRVLESLTSQERAGADALWEQVLRGYPGLMFLGRRPTLDDAAAGLLHFTDSWAIGKARSCIQTAKTVIEALSSDETQ